MKFAPYTRALSILLIASITPVLVFSQAFTWQGQTDFWDDLDNWADQNGNSATQLPNENSHIIIPLTFEGEIVLPEGSIEIASFSAFGKNEIELVSSSTTSILVLGSVNLGERIKIGENVEIVPSGATSQNAGLSRPSHIQEILQPQIGVYDPLNSAEGTRGGCPFFDLTADPTSPTCNGDDDGIAAVSEPTTGVGPYAYQWIGGPSTREWTGVGAGTYTVIVLDLGQGGLPCNIDVFVNEPGPLSVFSLNEVPPTCFDNCDGQSTPIVIGGNGGYTLTWSSGEVGLPATNLCATFTLDIEDSEGCTADTTVTFDNIPDAITIDEVITNITCFGSDDGIIDITTAGGTGSLDYDWTGPSGFVSASEDISSLEPGSYTLTVTDDNACTSDETFEIIENPELILSASATDNLCNGEALGALDLSITGGLAPYDISWTGPGGFTSADEDINGLASGVYEATVTDAANCVLTIQETVSEPAILEVVITPIDLLCFQDNSGEIDAVASGGTPVYDYSWAGPNGFTGNGPNLVGLEAGTYSLTLTDNNNCVLNEDVVINEPDELSLALSESPISCNGDSDGEIDLAVSGGTAPFDFDWTGPGGFTSTNEDITGLSVGVYEVTVEDNNGCLKVQSYDLTEPLPIELSAVIVDPNCAGDVTGEIDLMIANGTAPYLVAWTGPNGFVSTDEDLSNLEAGVYDVVVTDAGGCVETDQYAVQEPTGVTATFDQTNVNCFSGNDGSISTFPTGGVPPYNFDWTSPNGFISTDQNLSNLLAGVYTLTLSDNNGCDQNFDITITEPTDIDVVETLTDVSCFDGSDGEITLIVSGATPDYDFSWNGPAGFTSTNQGINGLQAGGYDLVITDNNDCVFSFSYTIEEPDPIVLIAFTNQVLCAGDFTGAIDVTVTGGNAPFDFSWTGPNGFTSADEDIFGLEAGNYTIDVEDDLGCTTSASYEIEEQIDIALSTSATNISCFGEGDGSIDLSISGGNDPYDISWIGPNGFTSGDEDLADLEPGIYDVVVTDNNSCSEIAQVDITEPDEIVLDIISTNIDCFGQNDGTISLTINGGTAPIDISWTGPNGFASGSQNLLSLESGEYTVVVADNNGCSVTDAVTITEGDELTVSVESFDSNCLQADGLAVATAIGGTGILTYTWSDEVGLEIAVNDSLIDVVSGTYEVNVTDELGCSATELAEISDNNGTLTGTIINPSCAGGSNGSITTQLVGGTAPFNYEWIDENGPFSNDENIINLAAGTYILSIEDAVGCVFTETFEVIDPDAITVDVVTTQISCVGADGTIDLTIQNAQEPFDVNWAGPNGFSATGNNLGNLEGGQYEYSFTDANGCFETGTVEIQAADPIAISETAQNILCSGDDNGSIDVEISGGIAPLDVSWTGPNGFASPDEDLFDLAQGEYTLVVTDQALCTGQITIEIAEPAELELEVLVTEPDCNLSNGSLEAAVSGGTVVGSYQIQWTDEIGAPISTLTLVENLPPGAYSVTVTDDNGCQVSQDVALSNPGGDVVPTVTPETCEDQMNGSIDLEINDVAEPFTVSWTGPNGFSSTDEDIFDLSGGTYIYVIEGADGCIFSESLELLSPDGLGVTATLTNTCFGVNEGQIVLEILGGEEPYTIVWTGPSGFSSDQPSISDLIAGDYTVSIVDNIGCDFDSTYQVTQSPEITATLTPQSVACFGESNGSIDAELSGGAAPLTPVWTGPDGFISADEDISNLIAGEYELTLTDLNGCVLVETVTVEQPNEIIVIEDITLSGCADEPNSGAISLDVSGGQTGGYLFEWTGPNGFTASGVESIENLGPGEYTYTVTDQSTCTVSNSVEITEVTPIVAVLASNDVRCFGEASGSIDAEISGGEPAYVISWSGPDGFTSDLENIQFLRAGDYFITITDAAGCDFTDQVSLNEPDTLELELASSATDCENQANGSVESIASGGTEEYSYQWEGPDGFTSSEQNISGLFSGTYNLTLIDANDCVVRDTTDIEILFELEVSAGSDTALCPSSLPLTLFGSISGGDDFIWLVAGDTIAQDSAYTIDGSFSGLTEIILEGSNGTCFETDTVLVEILQSPDVDAGQDFQVFTEERFTLGGNPTSTDEVDYAWFPNPMSVFDTTQANPVGFLTESTLFTVIVTDQNACTSSDTVSVEVLPDVEVNSGFTPNGDGRNDTWIIENIELFPNMEVHVYNRWGMEVFESQSYNANVAWDGTYEGSILPSGTYYYTLELNDPRFPDPITGPLTLHR